MVQIHSGDLGLVILVVVASVALAQPALAEPMPGDVAPSIVSSEWVRGTPIDQFEHGTIYVIDLWSSWCKPCIASMPDVHAIEKKFINSVVVIAMNVWEMNPDQRVPKFLAEHGSVMPAHVARDSVPEGMLPNMGLTAIEYLGTSPSASIPKSFIVDGSGRIAWIGLPGELEAPLSQVVAGTWEVAVFAEKYINELVSKSESNEEH